MSFLVQHKRSGDFARRPSPQDLATGQLAVNFNADSPGLFFKTEAGTLIKTGPTHVGSSPPEQQNWTERSVGEMWLDISTPSIPLLRVWTQAGWTAVSSALQVTSVFVPPTSALGLPPGAVWSDNGVLSIVP
jgi:hypothetical protein